uniref:Uncharacterized protein n=1 Tax=Lotharella oceanica TaxID=641309 RepID=A0A7S2TH53_9EUKA
MPAVAMLAAEFWAFEILVLMAGQLPEPNVQVIATTICLNVTGLVFMFASGTSVAVCARVGSALGAGRSKSAKLAICSGMGVCLLQWAVVCIVLMQGVVRNNLHLLFAPPSSTNPKTGQSVQALVSVGVVIVVVQQFFDGIKEVLNGVLRGGGRQFVGLGTSVMAYFMICIPLAWCLAFQKFGLTIAPGVPGLFLATVVASAVHSLLNLAVILATDWEAEIMRIGLANGVYSDEDEELHDTVSESDHGYYS